jgi:hypothetical protein
VVEFFMTFQEFCALVATNLNEMEEVLFLRLAGDDVSTLRVGQTFGEWWPSGGVDFDRVIVTSDKVSVVSNRLLNDEQAGLLLDALVTSGQTGSYQFGVEATGSVHIVSRARGGNIERMVAKGNGKVVLVGAADFPALLGYNNGNPVAQMFVAA